MQVGMHQGVQDQDQEGLQYQDQDQVQDQVQDQDQEQEQDLSPVLHHGLEAVHHVHGAVAVLEPEAAVEGGVGELLQPILAGLAHETGKGQVEVEVVGRWRWRWWAGEGGGGGQAAVEGVGRFTWGRGPA